MNILSKTAYAYYVHRNMLEDEYVQECREECSRGMWGWGIESTPKIQLSHWTSTSIHNGVLTPHQNQKRYGMQITYE